MTAFLNGWRRKAGCVTLVMACAVMSHWFRSQLIADELHNDYSNCTMATGGGSLLWARRDHRLERQGKPVMTYRISAMEPGWRWRSKPYKKDDLEPSGRYQFLTRYLIPGGEFALATQRGRMIDCTTIDTFSLWKISLLWLVIALMLLSAYLILWKPRKQDASPSQS